MRHPPRWCVFHALFTLPPFVARFFKVPTTMPLLVWRVAQPPRGWVAQRQEAHPSALVHRKPLPRVPQPARPALHVSLCAMLGPALRNKHAPQVRPNPPTLLPHFRPGPTQQTSTVGEKVPEGRMRGRGVPIRNALAAAGGPAISWPGRAATRRPTFRHRKPKPPPASRGGRHNASRNHSNFRVSREPIGKRVR
jgi:hypothetical protein